MPAAELKGLMQIIDKKGEYLYKFLARGGFFKYRTNFDAPWRVNPTKALQAENWLGECGWSLPRV
jgi:hypothetical protein